MPNPTIIKVATIGTGSVGGVNVSFTNNWLAQWDNTATYTPSVGNLVVIVGGSFGTTSPSIPGSLGTGWNIIKLNTNPGEYSSNYMYIFLLYKVWTSSDTVGEIALHSAGGGNLQYSIYEISGAPLTGDIPQWTIAAVTQTSPVTTPSVTPASLNTLPIFVIQNLNNASSPAGPPTWSVGATLDGYSYIVGNDDTPSYLSTAHGTITSDLVTPISATCTLDASNTSTPMDSIVFLISQAVAPPVIVPPITGVPQMLVTIYDPHGNLLEDDVSEDLLGGQVTYEDNNYGCGAGSLVLGLFWEQCISKGYWTARNIVEISTEDDVLTYLPVISGISARLYITSNAVFNPEFGWIATGQIYLWDGNNLTIRCQVVDVGTDGTYGDYIDVIQMDGNNIPLYGVGTHIGRRVYSGLICARQLTNDRLPVVKITTQGLIQRLQEAVDSFAITAYDVGVSIYQCLIQLSANFPELTINQANIPNTGYLYSGKYDRVTLLSMLQNILTGLTTSDLWVLYVGHDRAVRLIRAFDGPDNLYVYTVTINQGVDVYEGLSIANNDQNTTLLANSVEIIGDTDPSTKQPCRAIVQDATSISLYGLIEASPVTNTACKSNAACEAYGQAILSQQSLARSNASVRVYSRNLDPTLDATSVPPVYTTYPMLAGGLQFITYWWDEPIPTSISTTTTASFVAPALGTVITIPVASVTGLNVSAILTVNDGTTSLQGPITSVGTTSINLTVQSYITGVAGNTVANGAAATTVGGGALNTLPDAITTTTQCNFGNYGYPGMNIGPGGSFIGTIIPWYARTTYTYTIPTTGSYTFATNSDDGASLSINGTYVFQNANTSSTMAGNLTPNVGCTYTHSYTAGQVLTIVVEWGNITTPNFGLQILVKGPGAGSYSLLGTPISASTKNKGTYQGDAINGLMNVIIDDFETPVSPIFGIVTSVVTTFIVGFDRWQDVKFSAIIPDWNEAMDEKNNALATGLRQNILPPAYLDQSIVSSAAFDFVENGLTVTWPPFFAQFATDSNPVELGQNSVTLTANKANWVWINDANVFTVNTNPTPVSSDILIGIFQTTASGILGFIPKASIGVIDPNKIPGAGNQNLIPDSGWTAAPYAPGGGTGGFAGITAASDPNWWCNAIDNLSDFFSQTLQYNGSNTLVGGYRVPSGTRLQDFYILSAPIPVSPGAQYVFSAYVNAQGTSDSAINGMGMFIGIVSNDNPTAPTNAYPVTIYDFASQAPGLGGMIQVSWTATVSSIRVMLSFNAVMSAAVSGDHNVAHYPYFAQPHLQTGGIPTPYVTGSQLTAQGELRSTSIVIAPTTPNSTNTYPNLTSGYGIPTFTPVSNAAEYIQIDGAVGETHWLWNSSTSTWALAINERYIPYTALFSAHIY